MIEAQPGFTVEGHAIVSADGMIADAEGGMPPPLRNDADFAYFQAALDRASVVVLGRLGHRRHPNVGRRRLVFTTGIDSCADDADDPMAVLVNPATTSIWEVLAQKGISGGVVAVTGGRQVFDAFLPLYHRFVLAEVNDFLLPGGIACFSGAHPRSVLAGAGLVPVTSLPLGPAVTQTLWQRP